MILSKIFNAPGAPFSVFLQFFLFSPVFLGLGEIKQVVYVCMCVCVAGGGGWGVWGNDD